MYNKSIIYRKYRIYLHLRGIKLNTSLITQYFSCRMRLYATLKQFFSSPTHLGVICTVSELCYRLVVHLTTCGAAMPCFLRCA